MSWKSIARAERSLPYGSTIFTTGKNEGRAVVLRTCAMSPQEVPARWLTIFIVSLVLAAAFYTGTQYSPVEKTKVRTIVLRTCAMAQSGFFCPDSDDNCCRLSAQVPI